METRNYTSKVINKLIDEDIEYTKTKDVLNCQKQFYEKLYDNVNEINDDTPIENIIGENESKLLDAEAEKIEGEITYAELAKALKYEKWKESRSGWLYCWIFQILLDWLWGVCFYVYKLWL